MTGEQAVMALPDFIRVAGFDLHIEKWTASQAQGAQRWGEFSSNEQTIRIQQHMPTTAKAVDTFIHEVTHAIFWAYNIHDDDKEERVVGTLSTGLMTVHRDNPWLAVWLQKVLA